MQGKKVLILAGIDLAHVGRRFGDDQEITEDLKRFGRAGVPMYLVYRAGDTENPEVLPEFLTQSIVIDALKRAGPSRLTNRSLANAGTP